MRQNPCKIFGVNYTSTLCVIRPRSKLYQMEFLQESDHKNQLLSYWYTIGRMTQKQNVTRLSCLIKVINFTGLK